MHADKQRHTHIDAHTHTEAATEENMSWDTAAGGFPMCVSPHQGSSISPACLLSQHLFTGGEIVPERSSKTKPQKSPWVARDNKKWG